MLKRKYIHIKQGKDEALEMLASGKTQREVAGHIGFTDKYVVKEFVK